MKSGSRRRSRLEIYLDILNAVLNGESKTTRIMYAANLSSKSARRFLKKLVNEDYLSVTKNDKRRRTKKIYTITSKGVRILTYFQRAEKLLDIKL
jgi:predicted transcriptional regulator